MNVKDEQNHGLSERKTTLNLFFFDMYYEYHDTKLGALLSFTNDIRNHENNFFIRSVIINITENRNEVPVCLFIAGLEMELLPGQLLTTT